MAKVAILCSDISNEAAQLGGGLAEPLPTHATGEMRPVWFNMLPNIKYLMDGARAHGIPIIYVGDDLPDKTPEFDIWPPHYMHGTKGAEPWVGLGKVDLIVGKQNYVPFFGKSGEEILAALKKWDVDTVIACGICNSEMWNIAFVLVPTPGLRDPNRPELGYTVIYPRDCIAGMFSYTEVDAILRDIKRLCGHKTIITSSYELVSTDFNITTDTQSYTIPERTENL